MISGFAAGWCFALAAAMAFPVQDYSAGDVFLVSALGAINLCIGVWLHVRQAKERVDV